MIKAVIKRLFLILALLAPGLVGAADPTAPFSITVVPAGSSVPAGAQAAGFTTLTRHNDFTVTLTGSDTIDCLPYDGTFHQWYHGWNTGSAEQYPCNISQETDPDEGGLALRIRWNSSQWAQSLYNGGTVPGPTATSIMSTRADFSGYGSSGTPSGGLTYPNALYTEATIRLKSTPAVTTTPFTIPQAMYVWWTTSDSAGCSWEHDYWEDQLYPSVGVDTNMIDHCQGLHASFVMEPGNTYTSYNPSTFDRREYHKIGFRVTATGNPGNAQMAACSYIDDVLQACTTYTTASGDFAQRQILVLWMGLHCMTTPNPCNSLENGPQPNPSGYTALDFYIRDIKVWTCSDPTTNCFGTVLSSAP